MPTTFDNIKKRIQQEYGAIEPMGIQELVERVVEENPQGALDSLLFFTPPARLTGLLAGLCDEVESRFSSAAIDRQKIFLRFLIDLAVSLSSFLPRWNLMDRGRHGGSALAEAQIAAEAERVKKLLDEVSKDSEPAALAVCETLREETEARLKAEGITDPSEVARLARSITSSPPAYAAALCEEIAASRLKTVAGYFVAGETLTELGNDYAAHLVNAMYVGVSFVTTNPVLIDTAWAGDPDYWAPVVSEIVQRNPNQSDDDVARTVTLEVVLLNMRLLRPIYLLSGGKLGYVSLQVNPKRHDDAESMIADAQTIYAELEHKLNGGVPNVVFKLPGTRAGLEACGVLTAAGIGVTITVNFGLFQEMAFAKVIRDGEAPVCYIVEMNGRLAYPVRDELLGKLDDLKRLGFDEARVRQAAAWSGVVIHKRLMRLMTEGGFDLTRIRPLVASLRIYEGPFYEGLPTPFPDFTEDIGTTVITIFPNIRRAIDGSVVKIEPRAIDKPVPESVMQVLEHSEIFKQGFWLPTDGHKLKPGTPLELNDEQAVFEWPPVYNTLTQFTESYDRLLERIVQLRAKS